MKFNFLKTTLALLGSITALSIVSQSPANAGDSKVFVCIENTAEYDCGYRSFDMDVRNTTNRGISFNFNGSHYHVGPYETKTVQGSKKYGVPKMTFDGNTSPGPQEKYHELANAHIGWDVRFVRNGQDIILEWDR